MVSITDSWLCGGVGNETERERERKEKGGRKCERGHHHHIIIIFYFIHLLYKIQMTKRSCK